MKGLDLSEQYFQSCGIPMMQEKFGTWTNRIAAGLVGDGSECFGFDDEISRDHDWGPGFCIWLTQTDYDHIGQSLEQALADLPLTFSGFGPRTVSEWGFGRIGVFEIPAFFSTFTGLDHLPDKPDEWLRIPENNLAACTNGKVFYDPLGEFTRWRERLLPFYPEDVRLKKIAARCMTMAQFGQYNFQRCVRRQEMVAARYAETKFAADTISMIFLLNKRYTPFFKWMHRALLSLPRLGEWSHAAVNRLMEPRDFDQKAVIIEQICRKVIDELKHQELSDSESPFLLDHGPVVQRKIQDASLRQRNVWVG
jgi:hypothetical protein